MVKISLNFWKKKKVLITGHMGFKGSWLVTWLKSLGADVVGYSLPPPTKINLFEIANAKDNIISIEGNVNDFDHLKRVLKEHKPEIVFHMAAQSLVHRSYLEPRETFETNVMGTVNLLEAIRHQGGIKVIVNVTSDKCYENKEKDTGYKEGEPLGGHDTYSSSKACAEIVTFAYRASFFGSHALLNKNLYLASVRAGNVIGGGDWSPDRLIPDIVRSIFDSSPLIIRNPNAVRPWQHVLEPLSGYILLAEKLWSSGDKFSEAWNFGPDKEDIKSVIWIVEKFSELWKEKIKMTIKESNEWHETKCLMLDSTKAREKLGWDPVWNIDIAMNKTVDWYKAYKEGKNMQEVTMSQIREYEKELTQKPGNLLNI